MALQFSQSEINVNVIIFGRALYSLMALNKNSEIIKTEIIRVLNKNGRTRSTELVKRVIDKVGNEKIVYREIGALVESGDIEKKCSQQIIH